MKKSIECSHHSFNWKFGYGSNKGRLDENAQRTAVRIPLADDTQRSSTAPSLTIHLVITCGRVVLATEPLRRGEGSGVPLHGSTFSGTSFLTNMAPYLWRTVTNLGAILRHARRCAFHREHENGEVTLDLYAAMLIHVRLHTGNDDRSHLLQMLL